MVRVWFVKLHGTFPACTGAQCTRGKFCEGCVTSQHKGQSTSSSASTPTTARCATSPHRSLPSGSAMCTYETHACIGTYNTHACIYMHHLACVHLFTPIIIWTHLDKMHILKERQHSCCSCAWGPKHSCDLQCSRSSYAAASLTEAATGF